MRILRKKKKETGHTLTSWKGAWSCPDNEDLLADAENGAARYEKEISRTLFFPSANERHGNVWKPRTGMSAAVPTKKK